MNTWQTKEGICELALHLSPNNLFGIKMIESLELFLTQLDVPSTSVLIIYSTLDSMFSAGGHLAELYSLSKQTNQNIEEIVSQITCRMHHIMNTLDALPLFTICVIHGICFGAGMELALTCDLRIAEKSARFCFPELRLGFLPGAGGIPRLKRDLGNGIVRDLLFTGKSLNAEKALNCGLVNQLISNGEGLNQARRTAQHFLKYDQQAMKEMKAFVKPLLLDELETDKRLFVKLLNRPQAYQAIGKFLESKDVIPYV